jgi:predicted metalloprotease with PDZ domain
MTLNFILTLVLFVTITGEGISQQKNIYKFSINLNTVSNDKVSVELKTPAITKNEVIYYMPKIVPGTYSIDDFGRYIEDFKAFDKTGKELKVDKPDVNSWKISNSKQLSKITYKVNDSFDDVGESKKVFEPCGSNIQKDTNYLINNHCFIGYFEGMKNLPYELTIFHPSSLYGSTPLIDIDKKTTSDKFIAHNYNFIVDNPIMYATPDTATIKVGSSEVLIGVYSPNKKTSARFLADKLERLLQAQVKYMGGKMPVNKYAFLIYLTDKPGLSGGQGALEHSYSSVYFMPEGTGDAVVQFFLDVAAHEFFHIITPLNMHSEEIHYFDFNNPKMSKHLWLYEGTTEYHSHLAQVRYDLITKESFLKQIQQKITTSKNTFNDTLPFTIMSANVLNEYSSQFGNVYQKGALIAMCIDILLRKQSKGKVGIIDMINALANKYGKNKPFKDDMLFDEIEKMASPEIKKFLTSHVSGNIPLPITQLLAETGVSYTPVKETGDSTFTFGSVSFNQSEDGRLKASDISKVNE